MPGASPEDKRSSKRIGRKFVLRVAVDDGNPWARWSLVTTQDISAGGTRFVIDQPVKEDQRLFCKLHFVDREIECHARVIRLTPGFQKPLLEAAVSFEWKKEEDRLFIEEFSKNFTGGA